MEGGEFIQDLTSKLEIELNLRVNRLQERPWEPQLPLGGVCFEYIIIAKNGSFFMAVVRPAWLGWHPKR